MQVTLFEHYLLTPLERNICVRCKHDAYCSSKCEHLLISLAQKILKINKNSEMQTCNNYNVK